MQWEPRGSAAVSGALGATWGRYQIIINIGSSLLRGSAAVSGALGATWGRYQIIINIGSSLLRALGAAWVLSLGQQPDCTIKLPRNRIRLGLSIDNNFTSVYKFKHYSLFNILY